MLNESTSLINNNVFQKVKNEPKILNQTITEKAEAKEKRRLSQEKREKRENNYHLDKINYNINIEEKSKNKNKLSSKKLNPSISTKSEMKLLEQILDKRKKTFNIFDLSCLIIKEKTMKECNQILVNKLKKNGFYVISNKINEIKCSKNKLNCQIDITKIKSDNNYDKNIFCYKINNNKRAETQINKIISKIITS